LRATSTSFAAAAFAALNKRWRADARRGARGIKRAVTSRRAARRAGAPSLRAHHRVVASNSVSASNARIKRKRHRQNNGMA